MWEFQWGAKQAKKQYEMLWDNVKNKYKRSHRPIKTKGYNKMRQSYSYKTKIEN